MGKQGIAVLAAIGGFIGGFIVSEIILRVSYQWFHVAVGVTFLPILLPLLGAWLGYRAARRGGSAFGGPRR